MKKLRVFTKPIRWIKKHRIFSIILLIIILGIAFIFRQKSPVPPETIVVGKHDLVQSVAVSGSVTAKNQAVLAFLSSGIVTYIGAKQGDSVALGQTIATLDQRSVLKNLQNALLSYSLERNTYDQNVDNNQGRTNPNQALNDNMKRIIQNNQYNLNQAVVSVELQDLARQQSILSSPFAGIVTQAGAVAVGSTATPATTFTIVDPTSLVFAMDVDEADIGKIATGEGVKVTLDAYPDTTNTYTVQRIDFVSHTTTNGGNAFTVEVKLPDTQNMYRVGMNGNAEIITGEHDAVITIPIAALLDDSTVYVKKGTTYKKTHVILGLQSDVDTEVLSGLSVGDIVVTQPSKVPTQK